jgi:hypothetical protein
MYVLDHCIDVLRHRISRVGILRGVALHVVRGIGSIRQDVFGASCIHVCGDVRVTRFDVCPRRSRGVVRTSSEQKYEN